MGNFGMENSGMEDSDMDGARQFDVFSTPAGTLVVVIQSDLLEAVATRVVAPLLPVRLVGRPMRRLNPDVGFGDGPDGDSDGDSDGSSNGGPLVLVPQAMATLSVAELGARVGSVAARRDDIVRAVDMLLSGV